MIYVLTMHSKYIAGLDPMAWRLSPSTLDEGWQTRSPLVPYKLPRLLPHKGSVPGRSRLSPSWTCEEGIGRRQERLSLTQSVLSWNRGDVDHLCRAELLRYVSCINGTYVLQRPKKLISQESRKKIDQSGLLCDVRDIHLNKEQNELTILISK